MVRHNLIESALCVRSKREMSEKSSKWSGLLPKAGLGGQFTAAAATAADQASSRACTLSSSTFRRLRERISLYAGWNGAKAKMLCTQPMTSLLVPYQPPPEANAPGLHPPNGTLDRPGELDGVT
jgi:hypothetical protein